MTVVRTTTIQNFLGLSSDTKPTADVPAGSRFWETDTGLLYRYDGSAWAEDRATGLLQTEVTVTKAIAAAGNYSAEHVLSESATVGTHWTFSGVLPDNGGRGYIVKASVVVETTAQVQRLTLFLFNASSASSNDDRTQNDAPLSGDSIKYQGRIDFSALDDLGGQSDTLATPSLSGNLPLAFECAAGENDLFGILVTRDAFTNEVAGDDYTIKLTCERG